jgi:regulatory protein
MDYHTSNSNIKLYFLTILGKKDYSVAQLINKGKTKGVSATEVKEAIAWLEEYGYVNDRRFAENLIDHYKEQKGKRWISMKLTQKLIPRHIIDELLINFEDTTSDQIRKKVESKYGIDDWNNVDQKILNKALNYLARQGFQRPFEMINSWKQ